jgi:hypothetical protein
MNEGKSIVSLGDLSKPATVLIEKISDAVGALFRPMQIRRVAKAEADAERIMAIAEIEITELHQRALARFISEEARKQENMESITAQALPQLEANAKPEMVDDDWLANFFEKCRIYSDQDMQTLWAKILAGEGNKPGSFSKRTVDLVATLDKSDASLFTTLCSYAWVIGKEVFLVVFDPDDQIYTSQGINFIRLTHLDDIGMISFNPLTGFRRTNLPKKFRVFYYGVPLETEMPESKPGELQVGHVLLTRVGQELAPICGSTPVPGFRDYAILQWEKDGLSLSSPSPAP